MRTNSRTVEQKLTGYLPIIEHMSLNCVASCISVMHHNRGIVKSIEVTPENYWMPVTIHYWLPTWEEESLSYD